MMIYRAYFEGGRPSMLNQYHDSMHIFFSASTKDEASKTLTLLAEDLLGANKPGSHYECYNCNDEIDLKNKWALEPDAFPDAYLVECGSRGEHMAYVDDSIVFAVGEDRHRILTAINEGRRRNIHIEAGN
jgi:hypothetical protein